MRIPTTGYIFPLFLIIFSICDLAKSEQSQTQTKSTSESESANNKPKIAFSASLDRLKQSNTADEVLWIDVGENKHLILKHRTNGRKERGNILLLHAQGENADHIRIIQPLSKQLSKLGWNIFIPSIAIEDFPISSFEKHEKKQEKEATNDTDNIPNSEQSDKSVQNVEDKAATGSNPTNFSFENSKAYQDYFISLCQSIFKQTEVSKQPLIIIANQNAAYWSLECLNLVNRSTPTIFLQPELPQGVQDNLTELFAKQASPIFSFHIKASKKDAFSEAFKKRVWRSGFQRFNIGMLSSTKLQPENTLIARTITGWVDKQRKK